MTRHRHRRAGRAVCAVVVGVLGIAVAGSAAGAQSGTAPGVSKNAIKLGFIWSGTGAAAPNFEDSGDACQGARRRAERQGRRERSQDRAREGRRQVVRRQPHRGEGPDRQPPRVRGRQQLVVRVPRVPLHPGLRHCRCSAAGSTATTTARRATRTSSAWAGTGVLRRPASSSPTAPTWRRSSAPPRSARSATACRRRRPASPRTRRSTPHRRRGSTPSTSNTAVDFGTTDVGPIVLGLKNAGADAVYLPLDGNTNLAIAQGLRQNGVEMKAVLMASGYGQAMLDSPITKTLDSREVVSQVYKPAELSTDPAVKKFRADLKKYAGITGVPDYGAYTGYIGCDMAITGIAAGGQEPDAEGLHRRPAQARHLQGRRPHVRTRRHQPRELREDPVGELPVLHHVQERQVRRDEQGQADHRQDRR